MYGAANERVQCSLYVPSTIFQTKLYTINVHTHSLHSHIHMYMLLSACKQSYLNVKNKYYMQLEDIVFINNIRNGTGF